MVNEVIIVLFLTNRVVPQLIDIFFIVLMTKSSSLLYNEKGYINF